MGMSPVLKDPQDSPDVHDGDAITAALDIVFPWAQSDPGNWDLAGEFLGEPPKPKDPSQQQSEPEAQDTKDRAGGAPASGTQVPEGDAPIEELTRSALEP